MTSGTKENSKKLRVIAINSPEFPNTSIAAAASRCGHVGVIALEYLGLKSVESLLDNIAQRRLPYTVSVSALSRELTALIVTNVQYGLERVILLNDPADYCVEHTTIFRQAGIEIFFEIRSLSMCGEVLESKPQGIIVKGNESGGKVGNETAFILLQGVISATDIPVYVRGGIGLHSAAACLAIGARGVVLDWQLALASESSIPPEQKKYISMMDGSETRVIGAEFRNAYRVYAKPDNGGYLAIQAFEDRLNKCSSVDDAQIKAWHALIAEHAADTEVSKRLLMIGQDVCFAREFGQLGTVEAICNRMEEAALQHCQIAARYSCLQPDGELAKVHGTKYPIAQGPMTRVSDTAAFAYQVAQAGGLPFLALAVLTGSECDSLLRETESLLGDLPWGAGLLGFIPNQLREEQLVHVKRYSPPFALIAGGQPSQARELEEAGIATYLHVPSIKLLRMYVDSGSRYFVFEGRECGGHVGPRSSFVLWDGVVSFLLQELEARRIVGSELHLLFAGGIHDAASATMLMAITAPLIEYQVRVGVLLGTAYLFTEEAVQSGAIVASYQQEALSCRDTVLLESGVGHATRAADTSFANLFNERKKQLLNRGLKGKALQEALEQLNLGRLRLASKGIVRDSAPTGISPTAKKLRDAELVEQKADGMYMLGQVAALRDEVISISELHQHVSRDSTARLQSLFGREKPDLATLRFSRDFGRNPVDIAIIGMSCMLPKAFSIQAFWKNILGKAVCVGEIPAEHWDWRLFYDEKRGARDKFYSKWGGFIEAIAFDPLKYGMPPNSLASIEPVQLLFLEAVDQALNDAGYAAKSYPKETTSVILAAGGPDAAHGYGIRSLLPLLLTQAGKTRDQIAELLDDLEPLLPLWTEDSFPGLLTNVGAGRVANRFNFGGVNYATDAACGSSFAAIRQAIHELCSGQSDMVVAGAADVASSPMSYFCFSETQALSPTGQCRPLDASADGIVISEGLSVIVLKRLADAEKAGDHIYAVIKGLGASSDGRSKGLTAPSAEGQAAALRRAYLQSGVSIETIGLIEGHFTGTVVGDAAELNSLTAVSGGQHKRPPTTAIGSVKSMIGHTKSTAGLAGLIKSSLALEHKILPPTIGVDRPNSLINGTSLYVNTEVRPWFAHVDRPRRAGVSAFGFGGTNFHVVLEEYRNRRPRTSAAGGLIDWPAELFVWRASREQELLKDIEQVSVGLANSSQVNLVDLAAAICCDFGSKEGTYALALVASSVSDLNAKLEHARKRLLSGESPAAHSTGVYYQAKVAAEPLKIGFLFPGQGSQRPNMLRELSVFFPGALETWQRGIDALESALPQPLNEYVFPPPCFTDEDTKAKTEALKDTRIAQPALGAAEIVVYGILSELGIHADSYCGHSYGELVALCAAGVMTYEDLMKLSEVRGRLTAQAMRGKGGMVAVFADHQRVKALIGDDQDVVIANINSPSQIIVSGLSNGLERLIVACEQHGIAYKSIPVAAAFHSPWIADAVDPFSQVLASLDFKGPRIPVLSNVTASIHSSDPNIVKQHLVDHLVAPVRFSECIGAMEKQGINVFIEVGPGSVLSSLVKDISRKSPIAVISIEQGNRSGIEGLLYALASLAATGFRLNTQILFAHRSQKQLSVGALLETKLPQPPATAWMVNSRKAVPLTPTLGKRPVISKRAVSRSEQLSVNECVSSAKTRQIAEPDSLQELNNDSSRLDTHAPKINSELNKKHTNMKPQGTLISEQSESSDSAKRVVTFPKNMGGSFTKADDGGDIASVMLSYHQVIMKIVEGQKEVMQCYLRGISGDQQVLERNQVKSTSRSGAAEELSVSYTGLDTSKEVPLSIDVQSAHDRHPSEQSDRVIGSISRQIIAERIVALISEKTGYPIDMLNEQLDFEADLGIDSIKRVEIIGCLQEDDFFSRLGVHEDRFESLRTLSSSKAIIDFIYQEIAGGNVPRSLSQVPLRENGDKQQRADSRLTTEVIERLVVNTVSELTGYPAEMLGLGKDLESELGLDSIKRVEIFGALSKHPLLAVGDGSRVRLEEAPAFKSLSDIIQWIFAINSNQNSQSTPGSGATLTAKGNPTLDVLSEFSVNSVDRELKRFVLEAYPLPLKVPETARVSFPNLILLIVRGASALSDRLSSHLEQAGATVAILDCNEIGGIDGADAAEVQNWICRNVTDYNESAAIINLLSTSAETLQVKEEADDRDLAVLFHLCQFMEPVLRRRGGKFLSVSQLGGGFATVDRVPQIPFNLSAAAMLGFVKTLFHEWPEVNCRALDFEVTCDPKDIAEKIVQELLAQDVQIEVGYQAGFRIVLRPRLTELTREKLVDDLHADSVVLVTGGARGISADVAMEIAGHCQCRLIVVGSSPVHDVEEDATTAAFEDRHDVRTILINQARQHNENVTPVVIEQRLGLLMKRREISKNLKKLRRAGAKVDYRQCDVGNYSEFSALLQEVYRDYGRLDGVIHGAGVIEDKLLIDKTYGSFKRVYLPKVNGALALMHNLHADSLQFLLFFSSISARNGNKGQCDYAAANEALNKIAIHLNHIWPARVKALNWGPWYGSGMVSNDLAKHFLDTGVPLIPQSWGRRACLEEILYGDKKDVEVMLGGLLNNLSPPYSARIMDEATLLGNEVPSSELEVNQQ